MGTMDTAEHTAFHGLKSSVHRPLASLTQWLHTRSAGHLFLLLPALLTMLVFFIAPVLWLLQGSFVVGDGAQRHIGLDQYWRFFSSWNYLAVLWNSIRLSLIVSALCVVLGFPLALGMVRFSRGWRAAILVIVVSPLVVSVVVRSFAWQIVLRTRGPLNDMLMALGIVDTPLRLLFSEVGVVIGLVHVYLPFMVLPLAAAIEKIDPRLEEASRSLGANVWQRFTTILLPLSTSGMAAGFALVFTASISAYVTPALLGGERVQVMPTMIAQQILVLLDWNFGAALAVILTAFTLLVLVLYTVLARRFGRRDGERR